MMRLLHTEFFFAAGISLTVGSTTGYAQILLYTSSNEGKNEEVKKAGGGGNLTFSRDDALYSSSGLRLLPEEQKDFFSLSNYVSLQLPSLSNTALSLSPFSWHSSSAWSTPQLRRHLLSFKHFILIYTRISLTD